MPLSSPREHIPGFEYRATSSVMNIATLPPQFGVLLVSEVKSNLADLALNHHFENLPVLGHLYSTGTLGELDQGFIGVKSGSAR
jgi:hypothetical protein